MNADGTGARELTPIKADYGWPSWSPDGKTVSYASNLTGNHEIYTIGLNGGQPRRITTSKVFNGQASFTPDGKTLYYESADAAGNPILKRADLATGRSEVFVNADAEFPSVSPDGKLVAVTSEPASEGQIPVLVLRVSDRTTVFQTRIIPNGHLVTWMPDSASIVAVRKEGTSLRDNAYRFPIDGGPPEKLTDFHEEWRIRGCAIDSSGKKLLLVRIKGNSDIVAIGPLRGPTVWEWLAGKAR